MKNNEVEWKTIPGFEKYEISTEGRIRLIGKTEPRKTVHNHRTGGYEMILLYDAAGKAKNLYVHRLMVETYLGGFPDGTETRHLDGNPKNNRLDNLAVGTKTENMADKRKHGTNRFNKIGRGVAGKIRVLWNAGYKAEQIKEMLNLEQGTFAIALAGLGRTYKNV